MFKNMRKVVKGMATPAEAAFGHAAFSPDDVEDARRGRPAVQLRPIIEGLGLKFADNEMPGAFVATMPSWPDYVFNGGRGALPGGRYGQVGHELLEIEVAQDGLQMGGSMYAVRSSYKNTGFFGFHNAPPNEPFAANHAWAPSTAVHVRAPEAARLPRIVVIEKSRIPAWGNPRLEDHGLPELRMVETNGVTPELIAAVADVCRPWLERRSDPYLRMRVLSGTLNLTVNGYRADPGDLRQLVDAAEGIANGLAAMLPRPLGVPFDNPGPAVGSTDPLPGVPRAWPQYTAMFAETARVSGLRNEDATHLMSLLPRNPIPGIPWGVLFGTPAGTTKPCRIVWHNQGGRTESSVRGGMITLARPGASTSVGGVLHGPTAMYAEVVDGFAYCWNQQRSGDVDAQAVAQSGVTTLRALGLADA